MQRDPHTASLQPEFSVNESDKGCDKNTINLILHSESWVKEEIKDFSKVCDRGLNKNQSSQAPDSVYFLLVLQQVDTCLSKTFPS